MSQQPIRPAVRCLVVDTRSGHVSTDLRADESIEIVPLDIPETDIYLRHPLVHVILDEVLNPAKEAEDRKLGKRGVSYCLAGPDPWMLAIAVTMWDGVVQGLAWDAVKILVSRTLGDLRRLGLAPPEDGGVAEGNLEVGFRWIEYRGGRKQHELFLGIRRAVRKKLSSKRTPKPALKQKRGKKKKKKR